MAGPTRLELATSCVTGRRSNQLNYGPTLPKRSNIHLAILLKGGFEMNSQYNTVRRQAPNRSRMLEDQSTEQTFYLLLNGGRERVRVAVNQ